MKFILACLAALPLAGIGAPPERLPALNLDVGETSVSGLSSGGFMAVQFQVAHSSIVKGAGVIAGGPYYCAQDDVRTATTKCSCTLEPSHALCSVNPASADVPSLVGATKRFARAGLIDDPSHLARHRVFTLAGGKDKTVPAPVVKQLGEYYTALGLPAEKLSAAALPDAGHAMPTASYGHACSVTEGPYLNNCGFDAAGRALDWIYGGLNPPRSGTPQGRFVQFDQKPYIPKKGFMWNTGLDTSGWLYVPEACAKGERCRLHIALHGCRQGQSYLPLTPLMRGELYYGTTFVKNAGYDAWADTNKLVVLYPQAVSIPFKNPNGCWDWWGYTDEHYADKQGVQIAALRAMVERLTAGKRP